MSGYKLSGNMIPYQYSVNLRILGRPTLRLRIGYERYCVSVQIKSVEKFHLILVGTHEMRQFICTLFFTAACALFVLGAPDVSATTTKPVKTVSEGELKDACEAVGGTFLPSRHKGDGYACDRPDGTGVECHPGAGCEAFDTNQPFDFRRPSGRAPTTVPVRPGRTSVGPR